MASRPATLSVQTPETGSALPPLAMLARCDLLGTPACQFEPAGALVASSQAPDQVARWLKSEPIQARLREAVTKAVEHQGRLLQVPLFSGCLVAVLTHRDGSLPVGYTTVLLAAPEAFGEEAFIQGCSTAGLEPAAVAKQWLPLARFGGAAGPAMSRVLSTASEDLEKIEEQRVALEGFTVQLTDAYDTMDLLYSVGRSMREPFKPEQFLTFVCQRLHATMSFDWVAVRFGDEASVASGLRGRVVAGGQLPASEQELRDATAPLISGAAYPQVLERVSGLCTADKPQVLAQPLICKGSPIGVLVVGGKHGLDPDVSSYDIQLVEAAAGYINAFSDNVALYEDQHSLFMGTVQALTAAIDAKDRYTFGHSERVAHMASTLALHVGMSREQAERVRIAGLVHDVGKIGVPEAVLCKSGKLTTEEFAAIKKHPEIGHTILRDIALLGDVLPGVLHHHERYDGKGYPHGLVGEGIPLMARILAVADTFDAMSSTRSYRAAMAREKVLAEIRACAGTQLDPGLANAFLQIDLTEYNRLVALHAERHAATGG